LNDVWVDYNTNVSITPIISLVTVSFGYALFERRWCTKRIIEDNITIFFNIAYTVDTYSVM
jgi:hypothetical protein